jgi:hypothetical protein
MSTQIELVRLVHIDVLGSPTSRSKQGFLPGRKEEDILLVYPFDGGDGLIEKCAKGLNEASSRGGQYNADSSSEKVVVKAMEIDNTDLEVSDKGKASSGGSDKGSCFVGREKNPALLLISTKAW